jgi:Xanthine and CO dehydrogenases maturation factor, XdhC/CoxF family
MDEILKVLAEESRVGNPVCVCIVIETNGAVPRHVGSKMLVYPDGKTVGSVGGGGVEAETIKAAYQALRTNKPKILKYSLNAKDDAAVGLCGGNVTIYLEPQSIKPTLLILGAGHVGKSVAKFGKMLDFRVIVSDDRAELCNQEDFPVVEEFLTVPPKDIPNHIPLDEHTYIIMVTRGSDVDIQALPTLLQYKTAYIGVIGSKKRWEHTRQGLLAAGVPEEELKRIKTPIGLDISAETPDEIAISILAEIIERKNS